MISLGNFKISLITFVIFFILFLLSPIHDFNLWSQVIELRGTQMYFTDILTQAHFLRFFLVYPIFYFSDILNIDAEFLFKITCFIRLYIAIAVSISDIVCIGHKRFKTITVLIRQ